MAKKCIPQQNAIWCSSLKQNENDWKNILNSLGLLYVNNINISWKSFYKKKSNHKIQLPNYPFQKDRFYVERETGNFNFVPDKNIDKEDLKAFIYKDPDTGTNKVKVLNNKKEILLDLSDVEFLGETCEENILDISENHSEVNNNNANIEECKETKFSVKELELLSHDEQINFIINDLKNVIGKVLKLNVKRIDVNKSITQFGLDSIMAIELKNNLEDKYKVSISIADLIQGPNIIQLSKIIHDYIGGTKDVSQLKLIHLEENIGDFETSYGQKAMWFQHQMAPNSIFNPTYAVRIKVKLDIQKLKNVIRTIIDRHSVLRTTYHFRHGKTIQSIHKNIDLPFYIHDLSDLNPKLVSNKINEIAREQFDIEAGPVFKLHLFKFNANDNILLLTAHHISVDFWSQAIIVNEIAELYNHDEKILPNISFTYTDFSNWQKNFINSNVGINQLDYWLHKLDGEINNVELPTKKVRKPIQTFDGSSSVFSISKAKTNKLKRISENNNTTLYVILLSIYKILLYKYTHQNDIIVGTPTTGRTLTEVKDIVGYFVNPVAIRTKFNSNNTFIELVEQVKYNVIEALANQDYPFSLIVEKLKPERDSSRTPIFQVMFVYQKAHVLSEEGLSGFAVGAENSKMLLGGLPIESYHIDERMSAFDMTFMMAETSEGLRASITYNTNLFEDSYIERFFEHFDRILKQVVEYDNRKISTISLVDNPIQKRFLNNSELSLPFNQFVHRAFENIALKYPENIAVQFKNNVLTYREINSQANQLSHYLLTKNVKQETKIGVFVDRSFEMIISILAIMKAGCVYVPIDTSYPKERINNIITDANIKIIISQNSFCKKLNKFDKEIICYNEDKANISSQLDSNPKVKLYDLNLAYSIYTSGSTGIPKGVMLTHRGLINLVQNQTKIFSIDKESKVLQLASLSFDASVSEIFTALVNGATLHLVSQDVLLSGSSIINEINERKISVATIPPSLLAVIPSNQLTSLKTLVSAGELCTKEIVNKWSNGRKFINAYGPTEVTVCATTYDIKTEKVDEVIPIGNVISGASAYILDEDLNAVPVCVPGELYVSGVGLARGYNEAPSLTAQKFIPNPFSTESGDRLYKTGDLVKLRDTGEIEFLGRIDNQIKFRGFRIELSEVQTILEDHPQVVKAELILRKFQHENKLVAYYISVNNQEIERHILREHLVNHLPEYMVPSLFIHVEKIPLTHNGKVNKKALNKIVITDDGRSTFKQPTSEIEKKIVEIWEKVLNVENISTNDNFFDLGGHSLNVIQVQELIKEHFNKDFTIVDIFKYPTVSLFANYLANGNNLEKQVEQVKDRITKQKSMIAQQHKKMRNRRKGF
ncbi:MAG: amino acid adenylation domain-containing protein [Ignavibacteriae bacterium]|nr:amino acid adenylation domain-containing protein [Ignavibacteriota bacterium]